MADQTVISSGDRNRAIVAGFLGWTFDAFDFFLVILTSTAIAAELGVDNTSILLANWATLSARPLGAFVFGTMADRYGRRVPLILNLVFYSAIEVLTGLAPNFGVFIVLRFLFGIGMGGEWGVGASLMMEKVSPRFRGLLSGLLQEGYAFGSLLASIAYWALYPHLDHLLPGMSAWRVLFMLGGAPALLALFVRFGIRESEVWHTTRSENWRHLFSSIGRHWKLLLYVIVLMAAFNFSSHGTQDLYPTFLKEDHHLHDPRTVGMLNGISNVGAILGGLAFGALSDRLGRRRSIRMAFLAAILCVPLWAFSPVGNLVLLAFGGFLIQFMVQGAWGVVPAHLTELSPDNVRGFLPGFGYQCGALIAGSLPYLQESLASHSYSRGLVMGSTCTVAFLLGAVLISVGPERHGAHFGKAS